MPNELGVVTCLLPTAIETPMLTSATACRRCNSKKARKIKKKDQLLINQSSQRNSLEKKGEAAEDEVYEMSSGDEDSSKGMKKWIMEYHQSRPGLRVLQERIDDFIAAHEAQEEQVVLLLL
ncbi:uncharacterized protein LOC111400952 isoform X2 [Olea europaea var. sylvestris]|uniref:uncharacterized protein LOC111400952 isoform X2 n=1 Tax=Olea europaea var. sylvestris TaxID=158386 RepID=UPI000C1D0A52|nr:uncharacterized protein LOC111400952 isoform X2 [Olea europaea var. sylvestris]